MKTFLYPFFLLSVTLSAGMPPVQYLPERQRTPLFENYAKEDSGSSAGQNVRVLFYNAENLYDPFDDPAKLDDEFTPKGAKHWTYDRFYTKLQHLAKTLMAAGSGSPPEIVGLCEVENRFVLNKLVRDTPLKRFGYQILHHESPDPRGVDVALLYRPEFFSVISFSCIRIRFPFDTLSATRDILLVKGLLPGRDTVTILVNHWPSRRGGYKSSTARRDFVATVLRAECDSLFDRDPNCKILIMGDFNDEPGQESISRILKAGGDTSRLKPGDLVNLMGCGKKNFPGTIRYQGQWTIFDQFIVSASFLKGTVGYHAFPEDARIITLPFLLEEDEKYLGSKLARTYSGPSYQGGFSDHLPVMLTLHFLPY